MKYLEDLLNEAEEVKTRFEESKELILCVGTKNRLEQIVDDKLISKYNSAIASVVELEKFLKELEECNNEEEIIGLIIRVKK